MFIIATTINDNTNINNGSNNTNNYDDNNGSYNALNIDDIEFNIVQCVLQKKNNKY